MRFAHLPAAETQRKESYLLEAVAQISWGEASHAAFLSLLSPCKIRISGPILDGCPIG